MVFITQKQKEECSQIIFERHIDDFMNHLATSGILHEVMVCAYEDIDEPKNAARVGRWIRRNQWRQRVFDFLEKDNKHMWYVLEQFAEQAMKGNYYDDCY